MKVAIIGTTASTLLAFRKNLFRAMVAAGIDVYALAIDYDRQSMDEVRRLGVKPLRYRLTRSGLNPFTDIIAVFRLAKLLRKIKPDVVFSYFVKPVIYATLAAHLAGVSRKVAMLEGLGYAFTPYPGWIWKRWMLRHVQVLLYRLSFPFLDTLIFLNNDDPVDLLQRYGLKVNSVEILGGIGVNLDEYCFMDPGVEPVRFLFVGRLLAEKGIFDFLQAAVLVKKQFPNVEFLVLGDVDEANPGSISRQALQQYVERGVIVWPGWVDDVLPWLHRCSVFVLPSYREGLSLSIQEAMAVGRAVITTNVPGCRETVIEGKNGYLVPLCSPEALASKMIFFIEDRESIVRMGRESRRLAEVMYDGLLVNIRLMHFIVGHQPES